MGSARADNSNHYVKKRHMTSSLLRKIMFLCALSLFLATYFQSGLYAGAALKIKALGYATVIHNAMEQNRIAGSFPPQVGKSEALD